MSAGAPRLSPSTILRYEQLEGIAEQSLLDLMKLGAQLLGVERCFAGLVHPDDGWPRTVVGLTPREARQHAALFAYVMLQDTPTFVDDARAIEMLAHVPLVSAEDGIRLFAGAPIVTSDGVPRGALVLVDRSPQAPPLREVRAGGDRQHARERHRPRPVDREVARRAARGQGRLHLGSGERHQLPRRAAADEAVRALTKRFAR